jgi:hypothetical protein
MNGMVVGADAWGPSDPYLEFYWPGGSRSTSFRKDTYWPNFNEGFVIQKLRKDDHIAVVVMDKDVQIDDRIGDFKIFPHKIMESGKNDEIVKYPITKVEMYARTADFINIRTTWQDIEC